MVKYYLVGGFVYSDDGDTHYVSARKLVELYNVDLRECIIASRNERTYRHVNSLIKLIPQCSGDYTLPTI